MSSHSENQKTSTQNEEALHCQHCNGFLLRAEA